MEPGSISIVGWLWGALQEIGAPIIATAVSFIYFVRSKGDPSLARRILTSLHGVSIAIAYIAAMFIAMTQRYNLTFGTPYLVTLAIPVALIITSIAWYRGPKVTHLLQFLNVACLLWTAFVGTMAVTGEWL